MKNGQLSRQLDHVRIIAAALIIFLAAACCEAFDVSYDSFGSGGSITGKAGIAVSHSLVSLIHEGIREDENSSGSRSQAIDKAADPSALFSRITRKLLTAAGYVPFGSLVHFRSYVLLICTSACISLFCPETIRFIHLKDGSK